MKAVLFTNWTSEDFTWTWDSVLYTFPKGTSMMLQDYLANHFAKHLTNRELNKKGLMLNGPERIEYMAKCLSEGFAAQSATKLESEILNTNFEPTNVAETKFCDSCDSKGVRHKKECSKNVPQETNSPESTPESEFEGLK